MNTNEFLATLDYDQLDYAKRRAEELMQKKREESMVPLWVVCDEDINYAWFTESDHSKAVDRLCEEIRKEAQRGEYDLEFVLLKRRYRESEVTGLLAHANN